MCGCVTEVELHVLSAGSCSLWCQTSVSPKLGFNPKSELPFVAYFEFKGRLYPKQILPSEVTSLYCGFTYCLVSVTNDGALELADRVVEVAFNNGHLQIGQETTCFSLGIFWCNNGEPGRHI